LTADDKVHVLCGIVLAKNVGICRELDEFRNLCQLLQVFIPDVVKELHTSERF
jgi:hypothetical protein